MEGWCRFSPWLHKQTSGGGKIYRVSNHITDLDWFWPFHLCPPDFGWADYSSAGWEEHMGKQDWGRHVNLTQPNPGPLGDGSPCIISLSAFLYLEPWGAKSSIVPIAFLSPSSCFLKMTFGELFNLVSFISFSNKLVAQRARKQINAPGQYLKIWVKCLVNFVFVNRWM